MNDEKIVKYIKNEIENEFLDFKLKNYDWNNEKSKANYLLDVMSLANSLADDDRYIVLGAKVKPNGERVLRGINVNELQDSSDYQQLVTEHIEPDISVEVKKISLDGNDYGIIRIFNCNNKPYMIKKKYNDLHVGLMKARRGSRNTEVTRYWLDEIYTRKNSTPKSEFKIYGLNNGNIVDEIKSKKYNFFPDINLEEKEIVKLIMKINNFVIDDIANSEKTLVNNSITTIFAKTGFKPTKKEIANGVIENIKEHSKKIKETLSNNFFDVGNLSEIFAGLSTDFQMKYDLVGSESSKQKYYLITELNYRINRISSWRKFMDSISSLAYIELAIKEQGDTSDEEIEVILELPRDCYIEYDDFPNADIDIVDEINSRYSERMFKPYYNSNISDFRKMPAASVGHFQLPPINSLGSTSIKSIDGVYEYIDYDIDHNSEKTLLSFTIKSLKANEVMAFPGNIIFKNPISDMKYTIVSKKSNKKIEGLLHITN